MLKNRIFPLITLVCNAIFVLCGVVLAFVFRHGVAAASDAGGSGAESVGIALGAAILTLLMILAIAYVIVSVFPLVIKIFYFRTGNKALAFVCLLFDALYTILHTILFVAAVSEPSAFLWLVVPLLLLSLVAATCDVLGLKQKKPADGE